MILKKLLKGEKEPGWWRGQTKACLVNMTKKAINRGKAKPRESQTLFTKPSRKDRLGEKIAFI